MQTEGVVTKAEARRYVARMAAELLRDEAFADAEWIYSDFDAEVRDRTVADVERIKEAVDRLATELERRGEP